MSRTLLGKLDLLKFKQSVVMNIDGNEGNPVKCVVIPIEANKLYEGKKGLYADSVMFINDDVDQWGQIASLQQSVDKGDDKVYLGNFKEYSRPDNNRTSADNTQVEKITENQNTGLEDDDNLPF